MDELKTRSQWKHHPSPLDDIFHVSTEDFVDALHKVPDFIFESDESVAQARKLIEGGPDYMVPAKPYTNEVSKFVRIIHGWSKKDYVWHIEPASIRRPWKAHDSDVLYLIAKTMHLSLPEIEAKLWLPEPSWEIRSFTFKAMDLADNWAFKESQIQVINSKLFEVLNTIV